MKVIPFSCCLVMSLLAALHDPLVSIVLGVFVIVADQAIDAFKQEPHP